MNKAFLALVLVLSVSAQPALAGRSGASRLAADAPKAKVTEKARSTPTTTANAGNAECEKKKYFALIGRLVTVPCAR